MREEWRRERLADLAVVSTGPFGSLLHKSDYVDDGVPLVNPINIVDDHIVPDPKKLIDKATAKRLSTYALNEGDVVVGRRGEIGRCAAIGPSESGWLCGTGSFVIRRSASIHPRFLAHLIRSEEYREKLERVSTGSAMKNLSNRALGELVVTVPPICEQERIAAILDEAFAGISSTQANAVKNLQNAHALYSGQLRAIFGQEGRGWRWRPLGELCDLISGQHIDARDYNTESRGVGYLTGPSDFGAVHPVITKWTEHPKRMAMHGDILITVKGSGVGKINLLDAEKVAISRQLMAVRAKATDVSYLFAFLSTTFDHFQQLSNGAAIPGISRADVLELECPLPPEGEQDTVVNLIHAVSRQTERLACLYERKLASLNDLKASLLRVALAGALGTHAA